MKSMFATSALPSSRPRSAKGRCNYQESVQKIKRPAALPAAEFAIALLIGRLLGCRFRPSDAVNNALRRRNPRSRRGR
jgi:hypothetical protein